MDSASGERANSSSSAGAGAGALGRRRYLTLMFSDLSGSMPLGARMEPEYYADMLGQLRGLFHAIIPKHRGLIARIQGDGVLAIFGYPQAGEDDGRCATEAALELHETASRLQVPGLPNGVNHISLHTGIHGGLVYVASGDVERGRFELVGDVPNTAARLSDLALPGEIYVSEETLGAESNFFATSLRQSVMLRGKSSALAVYQVLGRAAVQNRFEARSMRGLAPFVGRVDERRLLGNCLRLAMAGQPQCVALSAGPGLGKTRLIEQLLADVQQHACVVLRGYCESYLGAEPLQPFLQMLRGLLGLRLGMTGAQSLDAAQATLRALPEISQAQQVILLQALSLPGEPGARPSTIAKIITALVGLIEALAKRNTLLLIVDDLQWADDASQQMLDVVRGLKGPLFVLMASRPLSADSLPLRKVQTIELQPLSLAEATSGIAHLLPRADPFIVAEIHRYAGGNPLFVEELCHAANAEADATNGHRKPLENRLSGAAWLNALIESRFARLAPDQAEIVRAAAVIGNVVPVWLLTRITGHAQDAPQLQALAGHDFLYPAELFGTLRFKHGITRDVVYAALGLPQRRAMHLAVANALSEAANASASEEAHEELAHHFAAAAVPERAAHFAQLGGDRAIAAQALDRARMLYLAALNALDAMAPLDREGQLRWCAVAEKLGMACVFDPLGLADGVSIFERGVALARQTGELSAMARAEYWMGYICYAKGLAPAAKRHCEASLALATQVGDERLAAQVRATLAQVLTSTCEYRRAVELFDVSLSSKRQQSKPGSSVAIGSAFALACKGCLLGDQGLFAQAEDCFSEALALLGDSQHSVGSSVRGWIAAVYMWQGRWEDAVVVARQSQDIAQHTRSRQLLAMSRALAGYADWVLTARAESLQAVREATTWIEDRNGAYLTSLNYGWLVDGTLNEGKAQEARRHAARLFMRARQHDRIGEAMGCRALARAAVSPAAYGGQGGGDFERAGHYLALAAKSATARNSAHEHAANQLCHARIEIQRSSPRAAAAWLDSACEGFERMQMHWHLNQASQVRQHIKAQT